MVASKPATVTERRAILTDREREIIAGDADVEESYRYQTISRVRARFGRLDDDLAALEEHGELASEFREIVCSEETPTRERRESHEEPAGSNEVGDTASNSGRREPPSPPSETPALRDQLRGELAGEGELLEQRVDGVLEMYAYLCEHGEAEKGDLLDVVDVGAVDYADAGSVWSNMVKGKDTLRGLPGVEKPSPGRSTWTYTGERDE